MMDEVILHDIPFEIDLKSLFKRFRIKAGSSYAGELQELVEEANSIARPKALYRIAYIESKEEDTVTIDGKTFKSRVLRVNLEKAHRVFPYVATCGKELEAWSNTKEDMLGRYWADALKEMALRKAMKVLKEDLDERYCPGKTSAMSPGSLEDWPITQQRVLFSILGNPKKILGVKLTDSCLMIPIKSLSGLRFPTEESFESCKLCPREKCPGRRAPYDRTLYDRKYR